MDPMNSVPDQFRLLQEIWIPVLFNYANDVFLMLATLEVGLAALMWVLQREGIESIGAGLLKKCLWLGFMYAVLFHADTWIPAIIRSFMIAGQNAAHVEKLNPGEVFTAGLGIGVKMLWELAGWGILTNTAGVVCGILAAVLTIFAYGMIAIELGVTLVESYIVTSAGVFLLGFSAFRGTATITERYLGYIVAVGIKLFVLYLIVGAGSFLAERWVLLINQTTMFNFHVPFTVAFAAILFATVGTRIPNLAGSLASGTVALSFGDVVAATVMATRSVTGAGTAAAGVGMAGSIAGTAARLGTAEAQKAGGGVRGAIGGAAKAVGALTAESSAAAVPRLHRVQQKMAARIPR